MTCTAATIPCRSTGRPSLRPYLLSKWVSDSRREEITTGQDGPTDETLALLAAIYSVKVLEPDETLYLESEPADRGYEILSGVMRETTFLPDGRRHVSAFLTEGSLLGLAETHSYTHTVEAVTRTRLIGFNRAAFLRIVADDAVFAEAMTRHLIGKLEDTDRRFRIVACLNAVSRTALFLLWLARPASDKSAPVSANPVRIPMGRRDIADHLGLSVETVCRCLTQLKERGLIQMADPHSLRIPNPGALKGFAMNDDPAMRIA
ncbi:MAG: Crp/Fnr family transcriptional regulator [Pseudomonadota bacterium]